MADVNRGNRPLSPHLQVYKPQLTSMSSIFVRITGIACWGLAFLIVGWLLAAATSPVAFAFVDSFLSSILGKIILFGGAWAAFYHMLGRLRHVIWDFGYCLEVAISEKLAMGMIVLSALLAIAVAIAF